MFFAPKLFVAVFFFFFFPSTRAHVDTAEMVFAVLCFLTEVLAKRLLPFEQV